VRALDPEGQVAIDGERWQAVAATHVPVDAKVVIESIDGLTMGVRPA
jgi:membrane protein implicated in regulation of membrane protease activity